MPDQLPPELEIFLYRAVQEGLTNIVRHAQAQNVHITLWEEGNKLCLQIEDDGQGIQPIHDQSSSGHSGLGLLGMQERVDLLEGTMQVTSVAGQGMHIFLCVPLWEMVSDA